jgi:hypothetical protein
MVHAHTCTDRHIDTCTPTHTQIQIGKKLYSLQLLISLCPTKRGEGKLSHRIMHNHMFSNQSFELFCILLNISASQWEPDEHFRSLIIPWLI